MSDIVSQYRMMDDAALNRVVLERLGYTANALLPKSSNSGWVLLAPDGYCHTGDVRHYIEDFETFCADPAMSDIAPHFDDQRQQYWYTVHWRATSGEVWADGPQYVRDLNLAWGLLREGDNLHVYIGHGYVNTLLTNPSRGTEGGMLRDERNPARAIVLAWLAMREEQESE